MVLNDLAFTVVGDGLIKGVRSPKPAAKKRQTSAAASGQNVPTSILHNGLHMNLTTASKAYETAADHDGGVRTVLGGEVSGSPYQNPHDSVGSPRSAARAVASSSAGVAPSNTPEDYTAGDAEDETGAIELDVNTADRQLYYDQITGTQREVWRPGDGDGDEYGDYFEKPGPLLPLAKRWRFYQLSTGNGPMMLNQNMPPKYVILDDRAAYEVHAAIQRGDIPRATTVKFWGHDFGGAGRLRARRPHRGRGAVGDPDASGEDKYHFAYVGTKNHRYHFTGEKGYTPIIYRGNLVSIKGPVINSVAEDEPSTKRKAESPPQEGAKDLRKHGHNQYTPKAQLVRYGAPSEAKGRLRYKPRINTYLKRDASPPVANRSTRHGAVGKSGVAHTSWMNAGRPAIASQERSAGVNVDRDESMWVEQDDDEVYTGGNVEIDEASEYGDVDAGCRVETEESNCAMLEQSTKVDRQALANPTSYMEREAAKAILDVHTADTSSYAPEDTTTVCGGSYASQVELELSDEKDKTERLVGAFEQAQARIQELEDTAASL